MEKKGQMAMVGGIVAVIIGVAMLPILASLIDDAQDIKSNKEINLTNTVNNQTLTLENSRVVLSSIAVINASCNLEDFPGDCETATGNQTMREGIEYSLDERLGKILFINRTGQWNISYDFKPTTYINSATGRTVAKQVTLMYGVALILMTLAAVGIFVISRRDK